MKSFQIILLALLVACASAFAPIASTQTRSINVLAAASPKNVPEPIEVVRVNNNNNNKNIAALSAFATAIAPIAAHATDVDEATLIGYGAGLVACVVSLAVGFAIGYGTLVKP